MKVYERRFRTVNARTTNPALKRRKKKRRKEKSSEVHRRTSGAAFQEATEAASAVSLIRQLGNGHRYSASQPAETPAHARSPRHATGSGAICAPQCVTPVNT